MVEEVLDLKYYTVLGEYTVVLSMQLIPYDYDNSLALKNLSSGKNQGGGGM